MTVKRYVYWCRATHGHAPLEQDDGEFVLYEDYERLTEGIRTAVKGCAACGGQGFEYLDDGTGQDVTGEPCKECFDLRELIGDHTNYQRAQQALAEPFPPSVPEPWEPCTLVPHCSLSKGHEGDCIDFPF